MKAISVFPSKTGQRASGRVAQASVEEIAGGRGMLAKVLRVSVDGTDEEIEYGAPPRGYDFLVLGHESFGQVEAVGLNAVAAWVSRMDFITQHARRICNPT